MSVQKRITYKSAFILLLFFSYSLCAEEQYKEKYVFEAGHPSLEIWLLPKTPPYPNDNKPTLERIELGKKLFFDPRLSRQGSISCASCHNPLFGWSDGLPTSVGFKGAILKRASPSLVNTAYNSIQMWDGRSKTLEDQALGPLEADVEMNTDFVQLLDFLKRDPGYRQAFSDAYPEEDISTTLVAKAISSFERTIISRTSPFDAWIKGDKTALTKAQIEGFKLFVNPEKGNCEVCHSAPNFTDNGFHNIGIEHAQSDSPDLGRHALIPLKLMKGAFKTPTLRDITLTAPYFHNGSAANLEAVMDHYISASKTQKGLSPNFRPTNLNENEKQKIVAFMRSLTSPPKEFTLPTLPLTH